LFQGGKQTVSKPVDVYELARELHAKGMSDFTIAQKLNLEGWSLGDWPDGKPKRLTSKDVSDILACRVLAGITPPTYVKTKEDIITEHSFGTIKTDMLEEDPLLGGFQKAGGGKRR
jgi:hypothetical protein